MSSQALLENMEKGSTPGRRVIIQDEAGERRGIVVFETDETYADLDSRLNGTATARRGPNGDVFSVLKFVFSFFAGLCLLLPVFIVITMKWCMWLFSFFPEFDEV